MAKIRKTIRAGRLVKQSIYTAPEPRDGRRARAEKSRATTAARKAMNDRASKNRLEMLIAVNFADSDLFLTLTYSAADYPENRKSAEKRIKKFFADIRKTRKARGESLKYIYVTESKHGEGRYHHHVIINRVGRKRNDLEEIRSLWQHGTDIEAQEIGDRDYDIWAGYLCKEGNNRPVGGRMYVCSLGMMQPTVTREYVDNNTEIEPPTGCRILEKEGKANEYGSYQYIKYLLPQEEGQQHSGREAAAGAAPRSRGRDKLRPLPLPVRDASPSSDRGRA